MDILVGLRNSPIFGSPGDTYYGRGIITRERIKDMLGTMLRDVLDRIKTIIVRNFLEILTMFFDFTHVYPVTFNG